MLLKTCHLSLVAFAAPILAQSLNAAPEFTYGDVTANVEVLGNPFHDFNYAWNVNQSETINDIQVFDNKLYVTHGTSRNGNARSIFGYNLATGQTFQEGKTVGNLLFNEEETARLRVFGDTLLAHSYDPWDGNESKYLTKKAGEGWRRFILNDAGQHVRDVYFFDGKVFVATSVTNDVFKITEAPQSDPENNFVESARTLGNFDENQIFRTFFEYNGKLFATSTSTSNYALYYDPADRERGWRVAVKNYSSLIGSENLPTGIFSSTARHISNPVAINESLLFDGFVSFPNPTSSVARGLYVIDNFLVDRATKVPMPGIPTDTLINALQIIKRDGRVYVISISNPYWQDPDKTLVYIHRLKLDGNARVSADYEPVAYFENEGFLGALGGNGDGEAELIGDTFYFYKSRTYSAALRNTEAGNGAILKLWINGLTGSPNQAPTGISLSKQSISENEPVGTVIGVLSSVDIGDAHSYSLVSGDTAAFSISGNQLRTAAVFDFEAKSGYSVKVRTTDSGGLFFERTFGITVNNLDEVTIYENWVGSVNWGTASLSERAKGSDPDGDGLSNELEWLLGYSPVARNPSLKFLQSVANMSDGGKTVRIAYPKASPESSIYLLQSPNLSAWSLSTPAIPTYESGSGLYVHNVSIPAGHGRMFFKLSSSPTVSAARQADDSFRIPENYAQGNLAGQSGGRGWSGAWSVTASEFLKIETAQVDPTGLVFPGLATSGGGIRLEAATRPHRAIRQLQTTAGTQETWVTWLQLDSEQYRTSGLELLSGPDVAAQVEMVRTAGFEMTVGNSSVATGGNPFSSLAYLCILKIDPVAKQITFWKSRSDAPMNLTAAPALADGISLTLPNGFSFDQISFFGGAYSTDRFDEIRVGSNFTAVLSE